MEDKDKKIVFLKGIIVGIFIAYLFVGLMFVGYKVLKRVARAVLNYDRGEEVDRKRESRVSLGKIKKNNNFKIGFEDKTDLGFFELQDGLYVEQTQDFVTEGKFSLMAEYPQGSSYPGLGWEVSRKDECLNWEGGNYFALDVHNNSENDLILNIKLKSGAQYPKKVYETQIKLIAQKSTEIKLPLHELKKEIDVATISYIKFFIANPQENITLYFDNIRIE